MTAIFSSKGVPLVDADQCSREMPLPGSPLLPRLAAAVRGGHHPGGRHASTAICWRTGRLHRPEGKAALDALDPPGDPRAASGPPRKLPGGAGAPLFVLDGAVIVGSAAEDECDHLAVVTAPFETSVARIAARDGIAPGDGSTPPQRPDAGRSPAGPAPIYVLRNDADLAALEAAAAALCEQLLAEGARKGGRDTSL